MNAASKLTPEQVRARDTGTYGKGLNDEQIVIEYLSKQLGADRIERATRKQDIEQDIDVTIAGVTCSIKCQHTATNTGNVCFELSTTDREGNVSPSWFQTGKAECYIVLIERALYQVWKTDILGYSRAIGWDRVVGLKQGTQQLQRDIGHKHVNVQVGLVRLDKLIKHGIMHHIGTLPEVEGVTA